MSSVLTKIEDAERAAEEIRLAATREARDMQKAVEEASVLQSRQLARTLAEETQRRLEDAKRLIGDEIKSLEVRRAAEREALQKRAQARVLTAGQAIFERVVNDGHR